MKKQCLRLLAVMLALCLVTPTLPAARADGLDEQMNVYVTRKISQLDENGALYFNQVMDAIVYRNVVYDFNTGGATPIRQWLAQIGYMQAGVYDNVENYVELLLLLCKYAELDLDSVEEQVEQDAGGFSALTSFIRLVSGAMDTLEVFSNIDPLFFGLSEGVESPWKKSASMSAETRRLVEELESCLGVSIDAILQANQCMVMDAASWMGGFVLDDITSQLCVKHCQNINSSLNLLCAIRDASTTDPDLTEAANILIEAYTLWLAELEQYDFSHLTADELHDAATLPREMNSFIRNRLEKDGYTDVLEEVWSFGTEVYTLGGTAAFDLCLGAGDMLLGTSSTYLHMKQMTCLRQLDSALLAIGYGTGASEPWLQQVQMLENYLLRLRLTLLGEEHLYRMVTTDAGAGNDIFEALFGRPDRQTADLWFTNQKAMLRNCYDQVAGCLADINLYYLELQGESTDLDALLARTDVLTDSLAGTVVYDDYYAMADDPSTPDPTRPHPLAGKPVQDALVELIRTDGASGDPVTLCSARTDENGQYTLVYPQAWNQAGQMSLRISAGDSQAQIVPVMQQVQLSFRSGFTSERADAAAGLTGELCEDTNLQMTFSYSDRFFLANPAYYSHRLARLSLGMAMAAYSAPDADRYWNQSTDCGREDNIRSAYRALDFVDDEYYNYDVSLNDSSSKVAFSIASREILDPSVPDGQDQRVKVIAVVIRGGGYGAEWSDNFYVTNDASPGYHHGFYQASREVIDRLDSYIQRHCADGVRHRIWITGYSRGAAVANLAAGQIDQQESLLGDGMYAYTFATPGGTQSPVATRSRSGLFNIVYGEDLVPMMALKEWGFGRNGATLTFSMDHSRLTQEQARDVSGMFSRITMYSGAGYDPVNYRANSVSLSRLKSQLADVVPSDMAYEDIQTVFRAIVRYMTIRSYNETTGQNQTDRLFRTIYTDGLLNLRWKIKQSTSQVMTQLIGEAQHYLGSGIGSLLEIPSNLYNFLWDTENILLMAADMSDAQESELELLGRATYRLLSRLLKWPDLVLYFCTGTNMDPSGMMFAHNAEVYLAWMMALDGKTLFGYEDPITVGTALLFEERKQTVNGQIDLQQAAWDQSSLKDRLDVDGDGLEEQVYCDWYNDRDYRLIAFIPQSAGEVSSHLSRDAVLYLCPGITYCDGNGLSRGNFADGWDSWDKYYMNLSLLSGEDGALYACADGVVMGGNGLPESYPEFFVSSSGQGEMTPVDIAYRGFLLDRCNGVQLLDYPTGFSVAYVDELQRWCLIMEQISEEQYTTSAYRTLQSCFSISGGRLQLEARFLDGVRVE
ncbi:MAG: hypothetical protein ACI4O7_15325 [Aristaeellaceae bacterium]